MSKSHTHFRKGKRLFVKLRNGNSFVAKFWKNEDAMFFFEGMDPIKNRYIRFVSINKEKSRRF